MRIFVIFLILLTISSAWGSSPVFELDNKAPIEFNGSKFIEKSAPKSWAGSYTYLLWARPGHLPSQVQTLLCKVGYHTQITYNNWGKYTFSTYDSERRSVVVRSNRVAPEQWTMIAVVYNETTKKIILYINGKSIAEKEIPAGQFKDTGKFFIGCTNPSSPKPCYYKGQMDKVKIYNSALGKDEILRAYDKERTNFKGTKKANNITHSYYRPEVWKNIDLAATKSAINDALEHYKKKLPEIKTFVKLTKEDKYILADCFSKRLEITEYLVRYIEQMLADSEPDSILYARQGKLELLDMLKYFDEMKSYYAFLKAHPKEKVLSVKDFGALGDGVHDDAPAFAKAFAAARKIDGRVKIHIPSGRYMLGNFKPEKGVLENNTGMLKWNPEYINSINTTLISGQRDLSNLTLEGEDGTILVGADPRKGILLLIRCRNVTLRNIAFDYAQLPYTQGIITEVDNANNTVKLKVDEGFPTPDMKYFLSAPSFRATAHDSSTARQIFDAKDKWIGGVKPLADKTFLIKFRKSTTSPLLKGLAVGQRLVIIARYFSYSNVVNSALCDNLLLDNLKVYSSPRGVFGGSQNNALSVVNCQTVPPPGSSRILCSNADPCMVGGPRIGPYLFNNRFEYAGDDFSNDFVGGARIDKVSDDGLSFYSRPQEWVPGYIVSIVDMNDGTIKGESVVKSSKTIKSSNGKTLVQVFVETPLNIKSRENIGHKSLSEKEHYEFITGGGAKKLSQSQDVCINRMFHGSGTIISGNIFRFGRAAGIFTKVSNAIIEKNTVEHVSLAMSICAFLNVWPEPNTPHTVIVRNNRFINNERVGFGIYYRLMHGNAQGIMPIRDIYLEHNIFKNTGEFYFVNCQNVEIIGNHFESKKTLKFQCVRDVTIKKNIFDLPRRDAISQNMESNNILIEGNTFKK